MNIIALLACGIVATAIGYIWYGLLFMKPYREGHKFSAAESAALEKSMPTTTAISFVGYVVTACFLSFIFSRMNISDLYQALKITFIAWLGLPAMVTLMNSLYSGKSLTVYAIDTLYVLSYMVSSACIIVLWP
jgi:hypothetical protein